MQEIYIGHTSRRTREFLKDGVATDLDALTIDIREEATGNWLTTTAEGEFHDLDIIANKIATGKYFAKITPDAVESQGVYLLYWTATYGTGAAAETFEVGPDVLIIRAEADIPRLADNYLSLDAIANLYPQLFDLEIPARILKIGYLASRDVDAMLDERFDIPIRKKSDGTYDQPLVDAAAMITVSRVLTAKGHMEEGEDWQTRAEAQVESINLGKRRIAEEITRDEIGFGVPRPKSDNLSVNIDLELHPDALYAGDYHRKIIVQIDTEGELGTATFKVSLNAGNTWVIEQEATYEDERWIAPGGCEGLRIRFFQLGTEANLAADDYWEIEAWPMRTESSVGKRGVRVRELRL